MYFTFWVLEIKSIDHHPLKIIQEKVHNNFL